jgi:hypothetical protein
MTKKIDFYSVDINLELNHPQPASKLLPEWFRKLPGVAEGIDTIKKCMPFLDSMTSGYMLVLAADVYFDGAGVQQIAKQEMVSTHAKSQLGDMQIPREYSKQPYKWNNFFLVKTPKGHSTLFTHPMNRIDLPFYTLSGIVETDSFGLPTNFPFFIKKDFVGVIPAGTPIAQALPFKRSDWKHQVEDKKQTKLPVYRFTMHNPPFGFYKKHFWSRKKYQ